MMFNKHTPSSVRRLIVRNYLFSTLVIALCVSGLIALVGFTVEDDIFSDQVSEAADQWIQSWQRSKMAAIPAEGKTRALEMDYYVGYENLPAWLSQAVEKHWANRTVEVFAEKKGHFHLSIRSLNSGEKLYVAFNARPYVRSTPLIKAYLIIFLIFLVLLVLFMGFFLFRLTHRVSRPLEQLAKILGKDEVTTHFTLSPTAPKEIHWLTEAIAMRDERIEQLLERERVFNRDISHELRTPLAVASGAAEILDATLESSRPFRRLKSALMDIQLLTEGILWLGREDQSLSTCSALEVCESSIAAYRHLIGDKPVEVLVESSECGSLAENDFTIESNVIPVPEAVAKVIIGNLLRNAFSYTDSGKVKVDIGTNKIRIDDTGIGFGCIKAERSGFGIGLTLVQRLSQRFNLVFDVSRKSNGEINTGTIAEVSWE